MNVTPESAWMLAVAAVPVAVASVCYIFFIAASLAIARSRTARLEELKEQCPRAGRALAILAQPDQYLLCTQFGRLLSSISAGFALAVFVRSAASLASAEGIALRSLSFAFVVAVVVAVLSGLLVLVQVAKAVSLQHPEKTLCGVAWPLSAVFSVFGPILVFAHRAVGRVLNRFNLEVTNEREIAVSADDLSEIVKMSSEKGTIEREEQALLEGVVELSDRITREVMTPRSEVVWVGEHVPATDIVNIFTHEGVSRVLVCGRDLDDVRGMLLAKDLFPFVGRSLAGVDWRTYVRPAHFVPNTKSVSELLRELRQQGIHLAVVLNEHGGVDGIVTLEDLVEEIVGEIFDEFDSPIERGKLAIKHQGSLFVDGILSIDSLKADYNVEVPEGDYETVAGFIMSHLGRLPGEGESLESGGWVFLVVEVHKHRIARVAIKPREMPAQPNAEKPEYIQAGNATPSRRR
jgi:putative hemolysin